MGSRLRRVVAATATLAIVSVGLAGPGTGHAEEPPAPPTPNPTVTGPVEGGLHGHPWYDTPFEVESIGYVEEEYFLSGTARTFTTTPATTADYTTRILVVRPASPEAFNGTVVVEWDNVTAQAAFSPMFTWTHPMLLREGYAFVSVSAQAAGLCCSPLSHQVWDPVRYGELTHPGDDYSFDIFSQAIQSIVHPQGPDPLDNLDPATVIAAGNSQSASRLHTYINRVQDQVELIDGFFLDAGGSKTFTVEPTEPVLHFLSEDGINAAAPTLLDRENYRLWEVPGASHNDADTARHIDQGSFARNSIDTEKHSYPEHQAMHAGFHYGEEGPSTYAGCQPIGMGGNEYPRGYAVQAAMTQLNDWIAGTNPVQPPRVEFDAAGTIVRDAYRHPLGGVRLPPLDVPVARYVATTCALFGQTIALDPITIMGLYPTHADYVAQMQAATASAVDAGYLLPEDGAELMAKVEASHIPSWA